MEAVKLCTLAAETGEHFAEFMLGSAYENGIGGLQKDDIKAQEWYRRSAEHGNLDAKAKLLQDNC